MSNTVIGVFDTYENAEAAKRAFEQAGFNTTETQLHPDQNSAQARNTALTTGKLQSSNQPEGGGGLRNFFADLFGSAPYQKDADHYAEAVRRGNFVLVVNAQTEAHRDQALALMEKFNPIDIDGQASHWQATGWQGHDQNAPALSDEEVLRERQEMAANRANQQTIQVIQEEMQVGKRQIQRGGVRVYQRIIETPVTESVSLREEHVKVERHAVDQPATAEMLSNMKDESFELREMAEEAVVSKTARVVEEVTIGKQTTEAEKTISDTVRRTDVDVEQIDSAQSTLRDPKQQ